MKPRPMETAILKHVNNLSTPHILLCCNYIFCNVPWQMEIQKRLSTVPYILFLLYDGNTIIHYANKTVVAHNTLTWNLLSLIYKTRLSLHILIWHYIAIICCAIGRLAVTHLSKSSMHHLKDDNGTLITDTVEIANTIGAAIEKSSSPNNSSKEFQSIKAQKEKQKINFKTNRNLRYNKKFTMRDLKRSLKKSNNSSPGSDEIHYEILRHLPIKTLHILLDIINETWKSDTFPESWREALIISIPKPGKDHFNPLNYRPIALTSCICKTVERMVSERLVWYLENNKFIG